jgi:hypothetical protein
MVFWGHSLFCPGSMPKNKSILTGTFFADDEPCQIDVEEDSSIM